MCPSNTPLYGRIEFYARIILLYLCNTALACVFRVGVATISLSNRTGKAVLFLGMPMRLAWRHSVCLRPKSHGQVSVVF